MLKRFVRNAGGAVAIEFALVLPLILVLYYGMAETTQALLASRRVSVVASCGGAHFARFR